MILRMCRNKMLGAERDLPMVKRNYRNNLEFIESGFKACWSNAQDLVSGSKSLLENSVHGLALSASVLALEELGKLFCIDGLLFARADDHKTKTFVKSMKNHSVKLSAFELLPLLIARLASFDSRFENDSRFKMTLAISMSNLKDRGNDVLALIGNVSFSELDRWKQLGFYAQPKTGSNAFLSPSQAVKPEAAEAVYGLAWRATSLLEFILRDGTLESYIDSARVARAKLTEEDHHSIVLAAEELASELFLFDDSASDEDKH